MPAEAVQRFDFDALGSTCRLLAVGVDRGRLLGAAAAVQEAHRRLTRFDDASELCRFNAAAGTGWKEVSPLLEGALRAALQAHELSQGRVHAGMLGAVVAAGYGRTLREGPTAVLDRPDPVAALDVILEIRPGRARLARGGGIDLGGVAKGWLADRYALALGDNCLVNFGGDLYARGAGPDGDGWAVRVGLRTFLITDRGAATSSTQRRRWDGGHHLVDPRTMRPADTDLGEVSVVANSGLEAEVVAKCALLMGAADATEWLPAHAAAWWMR